MSQSRFFLRDTDFDSSVYPQSDHISRRKKKKMQLDSANRRKSLCRESRIEKIDRMGWGNFLNL